MNRDKRQFATPAVIDVFRGPVIQEDQFDPRILAISEDRVPGMAIQAHACFTLSGLAFDLLYDIRNFRRNQIWSRARAFQNNCWAAPLSGHPEAFDDTGTGEPNL